MTTPYATYTASKLQSRSRKTINPHVEHHIRF